jgi:hypothetical protein
MPDVRVDERVACAPRERKARKGREEQVSGGDPEKRMSRQDFGLPI